MPASQWALVLLCSAANEGRRPQCHRDPSWHSVVFRMEGASLLAWKMTTCNWSDILARTTRPSHFSGTDDLANEFMQECDELVHEWEAGPKERLKRAQIQKYFKKEITIRELFRNLRHIEPEEFDDMYDGLPPDAQRHTTKTKVHRCRISKSPRKLRPSHLMQHRVRHSCLHTPNG